MLPFNHSTSFVGRMRGLFAQTAFSKVSGAKKFLFVFILFFVNQALWGASGITYHGRILKPNNQPLESATARFRIQIKSPGAENCLLWEEEQSRNMLGSSGVFSLTIGDGTDISINYSRIDTYGWGMERVFSNRAQFSSLTNCIVGNTYLPNAADGRILEVSFKEAPTDPTWESFPATKINLIPMSLNSLQLEGYRANEFLKVDSYVNQTPLSNASVNTLLSLIAGTSGLYVKPTDPLGGDLSGTIGAGTVVGLRGRALGAAVPTVGQVLKFNGTTWEPSIDDTGAAPADASYASKGIVQFDTNQAVSGMTVIGGVARLADTVVGGGPTGGTSTIPVITYDNKGRLTAVATATVDDVTKLPLAGGTMTGPINMGSQDITAANSVTATNVSANHFSGRELRLYNLSSTQYGAIKAPDALGLNYTLTLPNNAPTNGYLLSSDGTGQLAWIAAATGSVTGISSTNLYLTVDSSVPATPVLTVNVGTAANTVAAGNDARIVGALQSADYIVDVSDSTTCGAGEVPYWNTVGDRWMCRVIGLVANATTAVNFSGSLSGDVTGTQSATVVERIRGSNVAATAPVAGQVLKFDGTNYVPSADLGLVAETDPLVQAWAKQAPNAVFTTVGNELGLSSRVAASLSAPVAGQDGQSLRWNNTTSQWEFFTAGAAGSGVQSLNGQTGSSQSFVTAAAGTAPAFNSVADVHTLNIPLASGAGVLSGTISKADYDLFAAKLATNSIFAGDISGTYNTISVDRIKGVPVDFTVAPITGQVLKFNGTNFVASTDDVNTGDITSVVAGAGLVTGGTSGDVTVDVAAGNGITVAADSVAVDTGLGANKIPQVGGTALGANGVVVADGTGTVLSSLNCAVGQVIKFDASGFAVCAADNDTGATGFIQDGNSFGGVATLGTNDNFNLNFETNGTTQMTVLANGNVGVGTTNPSEKLSLRGNLLVQNATGTASRISLIGGNGLVRVTDSDDVGYFQGGLLFEDNAATMIGRIGSYDLYSNGDFGFRARTNLRLDTNSATRLFINTVGNVGVGTTTPVTRLDVSGAVRIGNDATACAVGLAGSLRYNGGSVEFCDGATWQAFGVSGSGFTSPLTTKGDLLTRDGSTHVRLPAGTDGQILSSNSATASGLEWVAAPTGDITSVVAGNGLVTGGTSGDVTLDVAAGNGITVAADSVAVDTGLGANKIPQVGGTALGANGVVVADGTGTTLSSLNCAFGQVIKFDASGFATCGTDNNTGATAFLQDGNSFGAVATFGTNDNQNINFETNGTTKMTLSTAGGLGIESVGTSGSSSGLTINANNYDNTFNSGWFGNAVLIRTPHAVNQENGIAFANGTGNIVGSAINQYTTDLATFGRAGLKFKTNSTGAGGLTTRMTIDSTGNVGIGTASPQSLLHISGVANTNLRIESTGPAQFSTLRMDAYDSGSNFRNTNINFVPLAGTNQSRISVNNGVSDIFNVRMDGNVGIGTISPSTTLDINGGMTFRGSAAASSLATAGQGKIYFDSTSNKFKVSENNGSYVDLVGGSGVSGLTTGKIPKAASATSLTDSLIAESGTNVNFGTVFRFDTSGPSLSNTQNSDFYINGFGNNGFFNIKSIGAIDASITAGTAFQVLSGGSTSLEINSGSSTVWRFNSDFGVNGDLNISQTNGAAGRVAISQPTAVSTSSATTAMAVVQGGLGYSATFMGGNVGIGTTVPDSQLQTNTSAINKIGQIIRWGQAGQTANLLEFQNNSGTILSRVDKDGRFYGDGSGLTGVTATPAGTSGAVQFSNGTTLASDNSNLFWDDSNNRLGIGTTTFGAGFNTLAVNGSIAVGSYASSGVGQNNSLGVSGNIGAGRSNPTYKIDTYGSGGTANIFRFEGQNNSEGVFISGAGSSAYMNYQQGASAIFNIGHTNTSIGQIRAANNRDFQVLDTTATPWLYLKNGGNVGIGTTTPQAILDINTAGTSSAIIVPRATTANRPTTLVNGMIRYNTTTALFEFYENGTWVNYTTVSDGRLKTNVTPVSRGLDIINQLNPVFFDWDQSSPRAQGFGTNHQVGFIAQEVEKVLPEVVNVGKDSYRSVEYDKIVSVVVAAVKELYAKVVGLEADQVSIQREVANLKTELSRVKALTQIQLDEKEKEIRDLELSVQKTEMENKLMQERLDKIEAALRLK